MRPSEKTPGDYALAFRTTGDVRHWKIVQDSNKFYVHPRPNPYPNLEGIVQVGGMLNVAVHYRMKFSHSQVPFQGSIPKLPFNPQSLPLPSIIDRCIGSIKIFLGIMGCHSIGNNVGVIGEYTLHFKKYLGVGGGGKS